VVKIGVMSAVAGMRRALSMGLLVGMLAACASSETVAPPVAAPQPQPAAPTQVAPQIQVPQDDKIRVALLAPLSGQGSSIGQALLDAAQLALFDVADSRFELMPRDTRSTPEGAAEAARDAVAGDAQLILGPLFSADAKAVQPDAAQAGVPVLSFSNDWSIAGGNLWVLGFQPREQVRRVVGYAASQGLTRYGVLAPSTPYGEVVVDAMAESVQRAGGQLAKVGRYTPGQSDLTEVVKSFSEFDRRRQALEEERRVLTSRGDDVSRQALRRLQNLETFGDLPFQAVMIADGGQNLREIAPMFPFFDVDPGPVKFLGTGLWDEPNLGREPALVGAWFAAPAPDARQSFEQRFQETYGYRPPRLATLAYDATALAAALARSGDPTPFRTDQLTNPNGFSGIDGIFRLLPDGTTERGLAVIEVTRSGFLVIDPAPQTFQPQAF